MDYFITKYNTDTSSAAKRCVLEDSVMQKGRRATAGSKILENFISPLDATVVTKLEAAGITILGKTKMDEFGAAGLFGGLRNGKKERGISGENDSDFQIPDSGPSSGAVSAVADGIAEFALCNDYTGAVSHEAAERGLYYIHPTYGTVSRYGLIPAVPSMDQIGIVCKSPHDGFRILDVITGYDPNDGAMISELKSGRGEHGSGAAANTGLSAPDSGFRIGVPVNIFPQGTDLRAICKLTKNCRIVEFELEYIGVFAQLMQILCSAELSNNISRYDGVKFGYRAGGYKDLHELYVKTRTEAFGPEVKLAAILGAVVLSQEDYIRYYDKAMRIRRLIKESLDFSRYDAIIMPEEPGIASGADQSPKSRIQLDSLALHALPRLCGLPAVTAPFDGGITLITDKLREDILLRLIVNC